MHPGPKSASSVGLHHNMPKKAKKGVGRGGGGGGGGGGFIYLKWEVI